MLPFTPSSQEMNPAYRTAHGTRMGLDIVGAEFFTVPVNQRVVLKKVCKRVVVAVG